MHQLPDPLGAGRITQVVHTEIAQRGVGGEMIGHNAGGDVRQQHLTRMATRPQPRRTGSQRDQLRCLPRRDHASPVCTAMRTLKPGNSCASAPLHINGRSDRVRRPCEHGRHAVALSRFDVDAPHHERRSRSSITA